MADETKNPIETFDLKGKKLFKMSHGFFRKNSEVIDHSVADVFKKNKWIGMGKGTKKKQAENFITSLRSGDYVYICDGGDSLISFARVKSGVMDVPEEIDKMIVNDGYWMYREVDILFYPKDQTIKLLKNDHSPYMPSGNSTFWEVPKNELGYVNDVLFKKNFGIELIDSSDINKIVSNPDESNYNQENKEDMILNRILYGPPGTGKTFHSISHATAIVEGADIDLIMQECEDGKRDDVKSRYDQYVEDGLITFCTFHQSMSYEDFIEGIKPKKPAEKDTFLKYDIEDGIFKTLCDAAETNWLESKASNIGKLPFEEAFEQLKDEWYSNKDMKFSMKTEGKEYTVTGFTNKSISFKKSSGGEGHTLSINTLKEFYYDKRSPKKEGVGVYYPGLLEKLSRFKNENKGAQLKNFVLIIDEINRGNVSQIFGELITLIEDDKRLGNAEALTVTLPYSGDDFGVPPNLYIIGTMNTADRSVEALDTALRRRFTFVPMLPEETKLKPTPDGIDLPKMLKTLNSRLKILKDADHTIGHAWLMNVNDTDGLIKAFANKILPLLQEYFYNDYEKLGMLLGEKFFKKPTTVDDKTLAKFFGSSLSSQYENAEQYQLEDADKLTKDVFVSLYQ